MSTRNPGPLLAAGRAADVYELGRQLVLRRYRQPHAQIYDARREAELMTYAHDHGFPVPVVHDADQTDIVMQRVIGPSMLASMARQPWTLWANTLTLAKLHHNLHSILAPEWVSAPFGDGEALIHLDLHPENVLLTDEGPVVIDWQNAARGPVGADLAKTWIILATAAIPARGAKAALLRGARHLFLRSFLHRVDRQSAAALLPAVAEAWINNPRTSDPERAATARLLRDHTHEVTRQSRGTRPS